MRSPSAQIAVACAVGLFACKRAPGPECFALVTTTDVHGAIFSHTHSADNAEVRHGGLIAVSGYVNILRKRFGDRLLLVDAGDMFQGTLASSLSRGAAVTEAYNRIGYDLAVIGNHEFDFGRLSAEDPDPTGVLKQRIANSEFPFLAANVYDRKTGKPIEWQNTQPSILLNLGGIPVGVIGVSTTETPRVTRAEFVAGLTFRDPAPLIVTEARELRARGALAIVVIGHLGGRCDDASRPNDLSTCEANSELFRLLRDLPPGTIDVMVGGHRHESVAHWVQGVATVEATANARQLGWVDVCLQPTGGIDAKRSTIHPLVDTCRDEWVEGGCQNRDGPARTRPASFLGKPVVPTPGLVEAMAPHKKRARARFDQPVKARLPQAITRVGSKPNLGLMVCDAMVASSGAQVAIQNRGGVRADLAAGPLRFGQLFEVLPFDNRITVLELEGHRLRAMVRSMTKRRGMAPYVRGLKVVAVAGEVEIALDDGTAVRDNQRYTVATNDFLAYGGEGLDAVFDGLADERVRTLDTTLLKALVAYLEQHYPLPLSP